MDEEEVLVAVEHRLDGGVVVGAADSLVGDALADVAHGLGAVVLAHVVAEAFKHAGGDILHSHEDGGGEAGVGELLRHVVGPETVAQIVVLDGGVLLQLAVAAVVVGGDKSLVADNLASAEVPEGSALVAEADDGVLDAVLVNAVDVFGRELETGFLHVGIVLADEREEPHALVGAAGGRGQNQQGQGQGKDDSFHAIKILSYYLIDVLKMQRYDFFLNYCIFMLSAKVQGSRAADGIPLATERGRSILHRWSIVIATLFDRITDNKP